MFSTPFTASSIGVATVSAMTLGLAPGYTARTCTEGGTTSGYLVRGRKGIAMSPATKMMIDNTAAKIGRSTKRAEKSFMRLAPGPHWPPSSAYHPQPPVLDLAVADRPYR